MSLTRNQWEEMWRSIKLIETITKNLNSPKRREVILDEVKFIKDQIQSVIGQME